MPLTLKDRIQLCTSIYDYKYEIVNSNLPKVINKDGSITVSHVDHTCTIYDDKIVFMISVSTSKDEDEDTYYSTDDIWEATATQDTISIMHSERWADIYEHDSNNRSMSITNGEVTSDESENEQNEFLCSFLSKINPIAPVQQLTIDRNERRINVQAFFQQAAKVPTPIVGIINSYVS
jgi:hypothetical protein